MTLFCCDDERRRLVRDDPGAINGIDRLEVVDKEFDVPGKRAFRQRVLRVFFVKPPADGSPTSLKARLQALTTKQVVISGGDRVTAITVESVDFKSSGALGPRLEVQVTPRGDYSKYRLSLRDASLKKPLPGLDPLLAAVDFSFKVECPNPFDCKGDCSCGQHTLPTPTINYLAKDYASFRQLLLDRLSITVPQWTERNPADLGITLVELLAYTGDYLSYRQDAIATEAYLGTARERISVRRHAVMLDYQMHEGRNARVWVQVRIKGAVGAGYRLSPRLTLNPSGNDWVETSIEPTPSPERRTPLVRTRFTTRLVPDVAAIGNEVLLDQLEAQPIEIFEPLETVTLFAEHNELWFHTWGNGECCLPAGTTAATLRGHYENLAPGMIVILAERLGPRTGDEADADSSHRHAVRLTAVRSSDGGADLEDALVKVWGLPTKITEIEWAEADALPFALCLSSTNERTGEPIADVSHALGNIVLADHGLTRPLLSPDPDVEGRWLQGGEDIGVVPDPNPSLVMASHGSCDSCDHTPAEQTPPRYRPVLKEGPLTHASSRTRARRTNGAIAPASGAFVQELADVTPRVILGDSREVRWTTRRDLLGSAASSGEIVAEIDNADRAHIRFGDDENGMRPGAGVRFAAVYRTGNGTAGNVGADSIVHVVGAMLRRLSDDTLLSETVSAAVIDAVTNPMPARGGVDPETIEEVRQYAPAAFRTPMRAVTADDYARVAGNHPQVQRAAATMRWTGSWHTVFLTVDRKQGRDVDETFEIDLREFLEPYRMAGHDLEIDGPSYVDIELELDVCVDPAYYAADVVAALREVFSARVLPLGEHGFFHPDNFTFQQPVLLSRIYAAALDVPGVQQVKVKILRRQGIPGQPDKPAGGEIAIGRLEIARLDSNPDFPDRGELRITARGGR